MPVSCPEKAACHHAEAQGRQLPPSHRAPTWSSFAAGFWQERGKGEKKEHPCWQAQGGGSWTTDTCVLSQFLPVASCNHGSEGLGSPRMLSHQQPPGVEPQLRVLLNQGSLKWFWGEVPRNPEAPSIGQRRGAARATSRPRSPSPFGTRGHPPPSPGSPDRAFCRWMAGSGCTGCHSTSPPAQRGEGQD